MGDEEVKIFLSKQLITNIKTQNFGFGYTTAYGTSHHGVTPMILTGHSLLHPTGKLLARYDSKGCTLYCTPNWTVPNTIVSLNQGPHISAKTKIAVAALRQETLEKVKYGFTTVIK